MIARGTNVENEDKVRLHAERERHLGVAPAQGHDAPQGLLDVTSPNLVATVTG
ncbi:hypothetical protein [Corynebacterium guaraldiae]|uniref:hypothetical protein n=1 Tax=Corynebacterium guaraldiae TaxID=3051103 RepID=UPI00259D27BC|nr:hypothetical protein [Corynebacterium guaraldiae]